MQRRPRDSAAHNIRVQDAGRHDIAYRNVCAEYLLEVPRSNWTTPPKVIEKDQAQILWNYQIRTDEVGVADQMDIVVVNKQDSKYNKSVVVHVAILSTDGSILICTTFLKELDQQALIQILYKIFNIDLKIGKDDLYSKLFYWYFSYLSTFIAPKKHI